VSSGGKASVRQLELPREEPGDEAVTETRGADAPVEGTDLLERVLAADNLRRALHVRALRWRWRCHSATSPRLSCRACSRTDPATESTEPPDT
jgi:hypothetical protein